MLYEATWAQHNRIYFNRTRKEIAMLNDNDYTRLSESQHLEIFEIEKGAGMQLAPPMEYDRFEPFIHFAMVDFINELGCICFGKPFLIGNELPFDEFRDKLIIQYQHEILCLE